MATTTIQINYTLRCTPKKSWIISVFRCCPPGVSVPDVGLPVTLTSLATGAVYNQIVDSLGHVVVPVEDGPYQISWPERECCKGGSTTMSCIDYISGQPYPCSPCSDITYGSILTATRDDLACCYLFGPVPKTLRLEDSLGGCDLISDGGCAWYGCSSGPRQNVDDLHHMRETKFRVAMTGDQSCISPLCYEQESFTGWFASWRDIQVGATACSYALTVGMDFNGRAQWLLSANWIDDPGEIIDYSVGGSAYWCAWCAAVYPPGRFLQTMPGLYYPCTDYAVDGAINFWRVNGQCTNDCIVDPTKCLHGVGVSQGYKSIDCATLGRSQIGSKGIAVNTVDPWSISCANPTVDQTFTLLPGKNIYGQQLVYGFESPKTDDWTGLYYPLMSPPPGGITVNVHSLNVEH